MFIKLSSVLPNTFVWLDPHNIIYMVREEVKESSVILQPNKQETFTLICLSSTNGSTIRVKETPEEIVALMRL